MQTKPWQHEDWGVGAETLLVPSVNQLDLETQNSISEAWENARCVPFLKGEEAFVTVAAARVLLAELFRLGIIRIYSTCHQGEFGLLICDPSLDIDSAYRTQQSEPQSQFVYLGAESTSQWEFLLSLAGPVLPDVEQGVSHVEDYEDAVSTWQLVLHESDQVLTVWQLEGLTDDTGVWQSATWSGLSSQEKVNVIMNPFEDDRETALLVAALIVLHPGSTEAARALLNLSVLSVRLQGFQLDEGIIDLWYSVVDGG